MITGPMGSGKDYVADETMAVLDSVGAHPVKITVGAYYYDVVAYNHGTTAELIRAHKAQYLSELQEVGNSKHHQQRAIWWVTEQLRVADPLRIPIIMARKPAEIDAIRNTTPIYVLGVTAPHEVRVARVKSRDGVAPTQEQLGYPTEVEALRSLELADGVIENDHLAGPVSVATTCEALRFGNKHGTTLTTPVHGLTYLAFTSQSMQL
ncbi:MAG: hypothetical protein ACYDGM_05555 [Vulcanimicrobiaceae bacterium]